MTGGKKMKKRKGQNGDEEQQERPSVSSEKLLAELAMHLSLSWRLANAAKQPMTKYLIEVTFEEFVQNLPEQNSKFERYYSQLLETQNALSHH